MAITKNNFLIISLFILSSFCAAGQVNPSDDRTTGIPEGLENIWNPAKYISIDEIYTGMDAYCLTEYGTNGIEMFGLEVVDIVCDFDVGRDIILVKGTDERFIRTGPVAGCSGSPVYINGRLAGALAATWTYSQEPIYAATPIEEMLRIDQSGRTANSLQAKRQSVPKFDFSSPISVIEVSNKYNESLLNPTGSLSGLNPLPCPIVASGVPLGVCEQIETIMKPFGFMVVSGGSGAGSSNNSKDVQLIPGASLAVPLVSGDIKMSVMGTVTEVMGDKVYGFGHSLIGYGQIDLPMATGKVHTVVTTNKVVTSFKLASVDKTVGALRIDESAGVIGQIGATAKTIPLTIRVDNYNDSEERLYNCQLINNELLSAAYLQAAVAGAALQAGQLPPEHTVEYKVDINVTGSESISFENISTEVGLNDLLTECIAVISLLMENPFKKVNIESFECDIRIIPGSISSHIWSVDLSDTTFKAGESVEIDTIVETVLAGKKKYRCRLEIPQDLPPGQYELTVCGSQDYEQFLAKVVPYRFVAQNMQSLTDALNNALGVLRDRLYFILVLPASGIALEKAELPDLPGTKALILQNAKRPLNIQPYQPWVENSVNTGTVVTDKKTIRITVEE